MCKAQDCSIYQRGAGQLWLPFGLPGEEPRRLRRDSFNTEHHRVVVPNETQKSNLSLFRTAILPFWVGLVMLFAWSMYW
jgi:hypothetical protein